MMRNRAVLRVAVRSAVLMVAFSFAALAQTVGLKSEDLSRLRSSVTSDSRRTEHGSPIQWRIATVLGGLIPKCG